jgi:dihydrofolate reductase
MTMRKLYMFNFVTLDGFFEGTNKWDIRWHNVDEEFQEFAIGQLDATDTILFGRVTYEGMAAYWTTVDVMKNDPIMAGKMNSLPKIVFSATLKEAAWNNTRLVSKDAPQVVRELKTRPGKDIAILGSAKLASGLMRENLIDEFRIMVNPVVLGKGEPLFANMENLKLKLRGIKTFNSGNVLLNYQPFRKQDFTGGAAALFGS